MHLKQKEKNWAEPLMLEITHRKKEKEISYYKYFLCHIDLCLGGPKRHFKNKD